MHTSHRSVSRYKIQGYFVRIHTGPGQKMGLPRQTLSRRRNSNSSPATGITSAAQATPLSLSASASGRFSSRPDRVSPTKKRSSSPARTRTSSTSSVSKTAAPRRGRSLLPCWSISGNDRTPKTLRVSRPSYLRETRRSGRGGKDKREVRLRDRGGF